VINSVTRPDSLSGKAGRIMIWLVSFTVLMFVTWSSFASLDKIVRGPGTVVPISKTQVIQSLEGGILSELNVWEGKVVKKGEVLARLSDAQFKGSFKELESQVLALQIKLLRLDAEISRKDFFVLDKDLFKRAPKVASSEIQYFNARQQEYKTKLQSLESTLELQQHEVEMLVGLTQKKISPTIDLLNARQEANEARSNLTAHKSEYQLALSDEYSTTLTEFNQVRETLNIRKDQLRRTTLVAPVRGIVNKIIITTIGGVAPPGEPILELTPLDDELKIEAKITPKDVAFIYHDMPATVKLSAYDYTVYGSFSGKVTHVSADTFEDQNTRDAEPYYKVLIAVDKQSLASADEEIEIRPGMLADAELHVGDNTVLKYLLKPLFKTTEAFREP